jgi:mRNA-degrading endonuclease RelE of RelBE toxin-antitoxin system
MATYMVLMTPQAKGGLRKAKVNEKLTFNRGIEALKEDPTESRPEISFLSKRGQHEAYRFRTTVGLIMYLVQNQKKEVVIIDIQPFKR